MTNAKLTYPAIPLDAGQVRDWKDIPIEGDIFDPLVPLGPLSAEAGPLMTSSVYFGEYSSSPYAEEAHTLQGSLLTLFVRQSVARRLLTAERLLPAGYHLLVLDAYRPYQVQESLYNFYRQKLKEKYPDKDDETLESETQKYVSLPSQDATKPSPHNTGGTVDITIVKLASGHEKELQRIRAQLADDSLYVAKRVGLELRLAAIMRRHASMLDFGTAFDHGGKKSALAYYESRIAAGEALTESDMQACNNRRLLFKAMTQVGFQPYFAEWWHFNAPETQMGAASAGLDHATFGAANFDEKNKAHENTRQAIRREVLELRSQTEQATAQTALQAEIVAVIRETGDPTTWESCPIEIMTPTP